MIRLAHTQKANILQTRCELLSVLSLDQTPSNCVCSKKPEECTYEALKTKLNVQFGVKRLVLVKRYHLYNYKQTDGQSLTDYLAELLRLSATCDWSEQQIADNLCDKFVIGLKNKGLLQQLLMKDHKKPLVELFQLALTFEAAEKESLKQADGSSASNSTTVATTRNRNSSGSHMQRRQLPCQPQVQSGTNNSNVTLLCASCGV